MSLGSCDFLGGLRIGTNESSANPCHNTRTRHRTDRYPSHHTTFPPPLGAPVSIEDRTGDLFAQTDLRAIAQGVNAQGVMGSGIAPIFRKHWPLMYAEYRHLCQTDQLAVGDLHAWQTVKGNWIYNLVSQHYTGKDARLNAIEASLTKALAHAVDHEVPSIGIPRIGAGIGGLTWPDVRAVLHRVAADHPVRLVIVSLPDA